MKRLLTLGASLGVVLLFLGCARQPGAMAPNMMPAMPPPPPCCCNSPGGAQSPSGMSHPDMRGNGIASRPNRPPGVGDHPPRPGMKRAPIPEQALKACDGKKETETCTFHDRGWTMTGICTLPKRPMPPDHHAVSHRDDKGGRVPRDKEKEDAPLACSPDFSRSTEAPSPNRKK